MITLGMNMVFELANTNIGDHPEGNSFCSIYQNGCRMCYTSEDGLQQIKRTKTNSQDLFNRMSSLYKTPLHKTESKLLSKSVKQHIIEV